MRVSIVSIILAGGMLALGACATADSTPMTLAELADKCQRTGVVPTGRQTGDARQDYRCRSIQATTYGHGSQNSAERASARDKILRSGG